MKPLAEQHRQIMILPVQSSLCNIAVLVTSIGFPWYVYVYIYIYIHILSLSLYIYTDLIEYIYVYEDFLNPKP